MICEHCRRNPCGCVVVSDGTRYAPARRVCGEVFDAGGYPQGCAREPHEGDDHRAEPPLPVGTVPVFLGGVTIVDADGQPLPPDDDAFPWDEPAFGSDDAGDEPEGGAR